MVIKLFVCNAEQYKEIPLALKLGW